MDGAILHRSDIAAALKGVPGTPGNSMLGPGATDALALAWRLGYASIAVTGRESDLLSASVYLWDDRYGPEEHWTFEYTMAWRLGRLCAAKERA